MPRNIARRPVPSDEKGAPMLLQFVLLSMLLHILVVMIFGTATMSTGGARRGDGWLGPLDVTLRQVSPELGTGFTLAPGADTKLPGEALLRRLTGSAAAPATAREIKPAPSVSPPEAERIAPIPSAPAPSDAGAAVPEVTIPPAPPVVEPLPSLDRTAPEEVDKPVVPRATAPPKVSPPAPEPVVVPRQVPMPAMAPLEKIAPPVVEPQLTPPAELRPREVPVAPRTPPVETAPREESLPAPAPVAPVAPPKIERAQEPAVEVRPRDVPMPPLAPIEPVAPPKLERNLAPIVEPATPQRAPVETPAAAEREAAKATPITPRSDTVAPARERAAPVLAPGKAPSAPAPARNEAPASGELPRLRYGAPDVDDEVFRSRRDGSAPAAESGGPPAITAESLRRRAAEIAREGSGTSGVLNLVPPPPPLERKDTLAEGIAKAAKPDCRTAYGGMGLLAVVPLVASTVGNGGCRW
jgi:hypothetical protein